MISGRGGLFVLLFGETESYFDYGDPESLETASIECFWDAEPLFYPALGDWDVYLDYSIEIFYCSTFLVSTLAVGSININASINF